MVMSMMTGTVTSSGLGGTAAAMAQYTVIISILFVAKSSSVLKMQN